jgi:hypothetical protein
MRSFHFRLPSPAMAVALVSMFIALGGTGYAATQLSHSQQRATAAGTQQNDNAGDTKLFNGLLAHAAPSLSVKHAVSATNASNAATVNKLRARKIDFIQQNGDSAPHHILALDGLVLDATCTPAGGHVFITAHTTVAGAVLHAGLQTFQNQYTSPNSDSNNDTFQDGTGGDMYFEDDHMTTSAADDVVDQNSTGGDSLIAHLEYATPNGHVVSVNFQSETGAFTGFATDCLVSGVAMGS